MTDIPRRLAAVRRFAWLAFATLLAVTTLSAFIRLSNAGLGCADWPRCYGEQPSSAAATAAGNERVETIATQVARLVHRVMAVLVLLFVLVLVMVSFDQRPRLLAQGSLALVLLALALLLAVLGRWSSGARVPAIALGNLVGGCVMLSVSLRLALGNDAAAAPLRVRIAAAAALALLLLQVLAGGMISASHAGLSCFGWEECSTAARDVPWSALDPRREPALMTGPPFNRHGALVQTIHRGLALGLACVLTALVFLARQSGRHRVATALLALLVAQLLVGMAMSQGGLPLALAVLHNVLAVGLFASLVLLL